MKTFFAATLLLLGLAAGAGAAEAPVILFDEGHGQAFVAGGEGPLDLSQLAGILRQQGFRVRSHAGALTAAALNDVRALVISGPFVSLRTEEIAALLRFVEDGGSLAVMLHIGPPLAGLLHAFGVDFSNGVIREHTGLIDGEPLNFHVNRLEPHPLFNNLQGFQVYGGWALVNFDPRSRILAVTGPRAWVDLNGDGRPSPLDPMQTFGVVVAGQAGAGRFVVFADDAIFQNRYLSEQNRILAANLGRWLLAR